MIRYCIKEAIGQVANATLLCDTLDIPPLVAQLLCMRGIDSPESAKRFLQPGKEDLHDPFLFAQMQDAVDCIFAVATMEETICVYGDYDVDGVCAVSILTRYLKSIGVNVFPYIPLRQSEGYGINKAALNSITQLGATLLITVDCGITAVEEIAYAYELGMEVIVTDHHQCMDDLPQCAAIINPTQRDGYPFSGLCGAGVAFKLVQALGGIEKAMEYIDIAAIATIADIVSLTDENRAIVTEGLRRINCDDCVPGIKALVQVAGFTGKRIDASCVGFSLAPRINAAGRTGSTEISLNLFLSDDIHIAKRLAEELDAENKKRQEIEVQITNQALDMIAAGVVDIVDDCALILSSESWNVGVVGIVASKLTERFHKIVILLCKEGDSYTGSGRSIKGIHLFDALAVFKELFVRFGGHEMAAGLTIKENQIEKFKKLFNDYLAQNFLPELFVKKAYYDILVDEKDITAQLCKSLDTLAPFGIGNPAPVLRINGVRPINVRTLGADNAHLKFATTQQIDCIAFGQGRRIGEIDSANVDMLCCVEMNEWKGKRQVQILVRQLRIQNDFEADFSKEIYAWKFYDAFCDSFLYNIHTGLEHPLYQKLEEIPQSWFADSCQGSLIVCFTFEGAKQLVKELTNRNLLDRIDVVYTQLNDECKYNAVLLAPMIEKSDLHGYKRVMVFDDCLSANVAYMLKDACPKAKLYCKGTDATAFVAAMRVEREQLTDVFRYMMTLARMQSAFKNFDTYFASICKIGIVDKWQLAFAIRVFRELEFIRVKQGACLTIEEMHNIKKRDLMESKTFSGAYHALESYTHYRQNAGRQSCSI